MNKTIVNSKSIKSSNTNLRSNLGLNGTTYAFDTFHDVDEKIAGIDKPLLAKNLVTAEQGHFYKGDPKFFQKDKHAIIQIPNITDCQGIVITDDSYRVVHAMHAPPGCFPEEDDSSASTKGDIDVFLNEIDTISKHFKNNTEAWRPKKMSIFIAGKNVTNYRIAYLTKRVGEIFKISNDNILVRSFECLNIYNTSSWVTKDIGIIGSNWEESTKSSHKMITITFSMNWQQFQISGPGKKRAEEAYICGHQRDWSELISNLFPNIKKYIDN